jgi:SAM-dependent methyltransferase
MNVHTKSFLRLEEYKMLSRLAIDGLVLDVGGSKKSGYHELIKGKNHIITANIDPSYGIDIQFNAEDIWPFPDNHFDGVLLVNILEHLYHYQKAINESFRVLKKGGVVAGVVPFMFNVHGSPSDYFRYTKYALERLFQEAGFTDIKIIELGTGACAVMYHLIIGMVRWMWMSRLLIYFFSKVDAFLLIIKKDNKLSAKFMPLGYYFEIKKQ